MGNQGSVSLNLFVLQWKNKDNLKIEDDHRNKDDLKNNDDHKYEDNLKKKNYDTLLSIH